jgi:UDP-N-acetyl-D-mannosaminuronic acid transferase (WecB/TagA/CpsF family)
MKTIWQATAEIDDEESLIVYGATKDVALKALERAIESYAKAIAECSVDGLTYDDVMQDIGKIGADEIEVAEEGDF